MSFVLRLLIILSGIFKVFLHQRRKKSLKIPKGQSWVSFPFILLFQNGGTLSLLVSSSWTSSLLFPLFSILEARYHYLYHHRGRHRCCSLFLVFWWHVIITCIIIVGVIVVVPSFKYFGGTLSLLVSSSWESSLLFPLFSILVARYHYLYHHRGRHLCCSLFLVFWRTLSLLVSSSWTSSLLFPLFSILVACYHYLYHHHGSHRCCSLFLVFWWHVIVTCIIFMDVIFVVPSF